MREKVTVGIDLLFFPSSCGEMKPLSENLLEPSGFFSDSWENLFD